jgi:lipopolysaccharide transport system ATP-binding protein
MIATNLSQATVDPSQATADISVASPEELVISLEHVGKRYNIYAHPQDRLKEMLFGRFGKQYSREFWSLRSISLNVRRGERVGIIGRNGAGKSTLLQIIAGTLQPTVGTARIVGRVGALLELGSGFNPEFTGRENVFMHGSIMGLSSAEVAARFDEIVAFADIGDFIDQPVKLYSSGMFLRLAFAVTTSMDVDVLLIDEALAVGDVFFRQKCYRRLDDMCARGTAIVLVSHSMVDIEQFCQRAVLLNHGRMIFEGASSEAVKRYYLIAQENRLAEREGQTRGASNEPGYVGTAALGDDFWPTPDAFLDLSGVVQVSNGWASCTAVALCDHHGQPRHTFEQGEQASFFFEFELLQDIEVPIGGVVLQSDRGVIVHGKNSLQYDALVPTSVSSGGRVRFRQNIKLDIAAKEYSFEVGLASISYADYQQRDSYSYVELSARCVRFCHLPQAGQFAVVLTRDGRPAHLHYHGVADLPGSCQVTILASTTDTSDIGS